MTLTLYDSSDPGLLVFKFLFSYAAKDAYKAYPGCRYAADEYGKGCWLAPFEARAHLEKVAAHFGHEVLDTTTPPDEPIWVRRPSKDAYPFQLEAIERGVTDYGLVIVLPTGGGKTRVAIEIMACAFNGGHFLIACPAAVRPHWRREIKKWDPRPRVEIRVLKTGKEAAQAAEWLSETRPGKFSKTPTYFITSYELLKHFAAVDLEERLCGLIVDELHMLANEKSGFSKNWGAIREYNRGALALGLSATPAPNRLPDLVGGVNAIFPGRFGRWWGFTEYYFYCTPGQYGGKEVGDLREDRLEELRSRIAAVAIQKTKDEIAHLLPRLTVQKIEVPFKRENRKKALQDARGDYNEYILRTSGKRISEAVKWIEKAGSQHVCALTYHRDTAHELSQALTDSGFKSSVVTGEHTPEQRDFIIRASLKQDQHFLVCTMSSVGTGVDVLAGYTTALFVELSYVPKDVIQAMGRFHRLSSPGAVLIAFLLLRGTLDDVLMAALEPKIRELGKTLETGASEKQLQAVLGVDEDEDAWFTRMAEIVEQGAWDD